MAAAASPSGAPKVFDRALAIRKLLGMRMRGKPRRAAPALLKAAAPFPEGERCTCHGSLA